MKGLNALELIFTLFVLIVVVLVIVRMFITKMSLGGIEEPIQDITDTYNYEAAYSNCNNLCSKYEADCSRQNAVKFCLERVSIDIDGNRLLGEKHHFNVVEGIPMCEDGIYCFHVKTDCACGSVRLDPETCLDILCDYYQYTRGLTEDVAAQMIQREIKYGTCEPDVIKWKGKIKDFDPIPVPKYNSIRDGELVTGIRFMGPDYWWANAGYMEPCGISIETDLTLECDPNPAENKIECIWNNCKVDDMTELVVSNGDSSSREISLEDGSIEIDVEPSGTYRVILLCANGYQIRNVDFG